MFLFKKKHSFFIFVRFLNVFILNKNWFAKNISDFKLKNQ
jgi:hypothetical protein